MLLIDMIFFWAQLAPDRLAVIQPEMVTTYRGMADAIESIGNRISQLNLDCSEAVAVSISNPAYLLVTCFALMRNGLSVAPVNLALLPHLRSAGIRNVIYDMQGQVSSGGRNIRFDPSWLPGAGPNSGPAPHPKPHGQDVDLIFFTSGSTGLPKKVVQTASALDHDRMLKYPLTCAAGAHQKILIMPGLASIFGFNRACDVLHAGKTACFAPTVEDALALTQLFGIEFIVASATQAVALVEAKKKQPAYQTGSLKEIRVGGGKIGPNAVADIRTLLCRNVLKSYGATETGIVAVAPFDVIADKPDAVGFVMPWNELQIVDEAGEILPPGTEGLIRFRTPRLMENLKAAGAGNLGGVRDEWFYPGDIGSLTADGVLCLAGRTSDVINRGGVKVSGLRIEESLRTLPQIKDAASCGVVGGSGLEEIWIAVVTTGPIDVEEIKRHLSEQDDIKTAPDEVFFLEELPRGELGKVQKHRLKEILLERKREASKAPR